MKKAMAVAGVLPLAMMIVSAQTQTALNVKDLVELELHTHTEVTEKLKDGWTSILLVTGGTEERGPQDVLGGHTMMAHSHADMIARKLGRTLVAPSQIQTPVPASATCITCRAKSQAGWSMC